MTKRFPLYILEGADRVGKSTLANLLANHIPNSKVHHFSKPVALQKLKYGVHYQYDFLAKVKPTQPIILDRSWVSGMFYDMLRRHREPSWREAMKLEHQITANGYDIHIIFVYRDWNFSLELEHLKEIDRQEGFGDIYQRVHEHFHWPGFFKQWAPFTPATIWIADNPIELTMGTSVKLIKDSSSPSEPMAYPKSFLINSLVNSHNNHEAGPKPSQVIKDLSVIFNKQSASGFDTSVWDQFQWTYSHPSGISNILGSHPTQNH